MQGIPYESLVTVSSPTRWCVWANLKNSCSSIFNSFYIKQNEKAWLWLRVFRRALVPRFYKKKRKISSGYSSYIYSRVSNRNHRYPANYQNHPCVFNYSFRWLRLPYSQYLFETMLRRAIRLMFSHKESMICLFALFQPWVNTLVVSLQPI